MFTHEFTTKIYQCVKMYVEYLKPKAEKIKVFITRLVFISLAVRLLFIF